ncbi:nickel ABC transporter, nickel/metallophore periplasmic binding protein [Saccharibacillus sp. O23]|uniref:nickel ABC transporter substrate-binding protein n=1 Tax=Saccharibacillus sp. O23 TaxID=2009338 RepID=UPI000B4E1AF7|nr:nickel ABC transporter substrate-binding protein [Saccharibacillus sp. O23]OWR30020.1 nickel ABC transporter, nickel/metallophore periplasmic binding protein [Saccharibacillus sp. O23]
MPFTFWRKTITGFTLLAMLLGGCSGAGGSNEAAETPAAKGTHGMPQEASGEMTIAVSRDVGLDKLDAGAYEGSMDVHAMIYDGLVRYGEKGEIEPALAETWDISEDGKTYTFHLRKGVKFSDGSEFNAEAAKFSFERWVHDPSNSLAVATAMQTLEAIDDYTIRMTFDRAYYPLLTELTFARPVRMISPNSVEPAGDIKGTFVKPIGTGAWMAERYKADQEAVLVRNPNYWGEAPKLSKITLKVIPDPQSRVLALQSGEVDLAGGAMGRLPLESLAVLEGDESLNILRSPGTSSHFLIFNGKNPQLQNLDVRKAINLAIDKQSIARDLMGGIGSEAKGLFPATVPYVTESNSQGYGFDPEQAKTLLTQAGYADEDGDGIAEKDGKPLSFNLVLQQVDYPEWKTMSEMIQSELKSIGIGVNLQVLEPNAYYDALWTTKAYDIIIYRTYDDAYNPHSFLSSLFRKTASAPAAAWSDEQLEEMIAAVLASTNEAERQTTYDAIFKRMKEEAMFATLYYPEELFVYNKRVRQAKAGHTTFEAIRWNELEVGR